MYTSNKNFWFWFLTVLMQINNALSIAVIQFNRKKQKTSLDFEISFFLLKDCSELRLNSSYMVINDKMRQAILLLYNYHFELINVKFIKLGFSKKIIDIINCDIPTVSCHKSFTLQIFLIIFFDKKIFWMKLSILRKKNKINMNFIVTEFLD